MPDTSRRQTTKVWYVVAAVAVAAIALIPSFSESDSSPTTVSSPPPPVIPDPSSVYDPVRAGEPLPDGYRQVLGRDMIHPIYEPAFVDSAGVDWPDNTDVIGIASANEAKAYPVSHLSFREMVIDEIGGLPVLVSW